LFFVFRLLLFYVVIHVPQLFHCDWANAAWNMGCLGIVSSRGGGMRAPDVGCCMQHGSQHGSLGYCAREEGPWHWMLHTTWLTTFPLNIFLKYCKSLFWMLERLISLLQTFFMLRSVWWESSGVETVLKHQTPNGLTVRSTIPAGT
jgi:hypothetical protein